MLKPRVKWAVQNNPESSACGWVWPCLCTRPCTLPLSRSWQGSGITSRILTPKSCLLPPAPLRDPGLLSQPDHCEDKSVPYGRRTPGQRGTVRSSDQTHGKHSALTGTESRPDSTGGEQPGLLCGTVENQIKKKLKNKQILRCTLHPASSCTECMSCLGCWQRVIFCCKNIHGYYLIFAVCRSRPVSCYCSENWSSTSWKSIQAFWDHTAIQT